MNVPKLRFKEFTDEWQKKPLKDIVYSNIIEVPKPTTDYIRLGIRSHCKGTFHELVKIENILSADKMYIVPKDNLILNITFAWEQAIAITDKNDEGKYVSNRFPTFAFKNNQLPAFYKYIISQNRLKYDLNVASPGGAGRNRVLNKKLFLLIPINIPSFEEQKKIANFLSTVDKKIANLENIITTLENQKKGLLQQIFNQKLRFKDENGNNYPDWEKKKLGDILKICHGKDYKNEPNEKKLYPVLGTGGIITYIDNFLCDWKCVLIGRKGTINKPQYMETPFWSVDTLFYSKPKAKQNPKFQYYLFQNINWIKYDESTGVPSLSASTIENIPFSLPCLEEQTKIADFLSAFDRKIDNQKAQLEHWKQIKKGLLQQMFV
ncbi:restriction endonuclease subunit S [Megamonas hypermegale]|uniref:restriction endonuclease subunit S n=1 Tax=Megamonas hypermegale TaxID=158847 RepID=UPI00195D497C|nr:restriction endonuclease subunit S [Megamonas hypermegale]MBM6760049.1 restriction endonuclease subunit S [Megamonas hypermegale]